MDDRVVDDDGVAVHHHRMGNDDPVGVQAGESFGERGLAGTRRAVEEHRVLAVECRPQLVEHVVLDDEVGERVSNGAAVDGDRDPLERHCVGVGVKRHRGDPGVLAALRPVPGLFTPDRGERKRVVVAGQALDVQQLLGSELFERLADDAGGESEAARKAVDRRGVVGHRAPQHEIDDRRERDVESAALRGCGNIELSAGHEGVYRHTRCAV